MNIIAAVGINWTPRLGLRPPGGAAQVKAVVLMPVIQLAVVVAANERRFGVTYPWSARGRYGACIAYTFAQLEEAIRSSWGPDTVDPDDGWSEANPAQGHCDVTCLVVNDLVGGELVAADVFLDGQRIMAHMWNRLPSEIEIDLTREQFKRGEILGEARFVQRPPDSVLADPAHHRHHRYLQYLVLAERVRSRLGAR